MIVRRRKTAVFFLVLGIGLSILAIMLNVGWIFLNLRQAALLVLGIIFFALIITGLILNTVFLVREIRRSEQHDAFLNSITHELKTPIASIKLYLDTLRSRELSREKQLEFFDVMHSDTERLISTVEQVLDASRARERRRQLNLQELDLHGVITEAAATVRTRYNLADGVIRVSDPGQPIVVVADPSDMQTAFINLLDNAVKYSGDDRKISIRAKASTLTKKVDVYIRDNGIGIASDELRRVFKRFYRSAGSAASTKGTGLGLAIVQAIIKDHGGRLRAQSRGIGHGSTFHVQLPRSS